jgi:hypothetical protein
MNVLCKLSIAQQGGGGQLAKLNLQLRPGTLTHDSGLIQLMHRNELMRPKKAAIF